MSSAAVVIGAFRVKPLLPKGPVFSYCLEEELISSFSIKIHASCVDSVKCCILWHQPWVCTVYICLSKQVSSKTCCIQDSSSDSTLPITLMKTSNLDGDVDADTSVTIALPELLFRQAKKIDSYQYILYVLSVCTIFSNLTFIFYLAFGSYFFY